MDVIILVNFYCRAGGSENYEHCTTCEMCMPKGVPHKCIGMYVKFLFIFFVNIRLSVRFVELRSYG